jgi:ABC-2 type transport system ATP-binding protein
METGMSQPIAIEVERLSKRFGSFQALQDLNLEVRPGVIFGLLGPNGAGKTTTIRILITLLRPDSGTARVWGLDVVSDSRRVRQNIGYVPQEKSVDRFLTGREHLDLLADLYHLTPAEKKKRIPELLDLMGLQEKADEVITAYSGGMKKKLDIACGLIPNPRVLFMDEPTLGLDVESRMRVWEYIRRLKTAGMTILMSTNYLDEADQLCDGLAIIDRGRSVAVGTPQELKKGLGGDRVSILFNGKSSGLEELARRLKNDLPFVNEVTIGSAEPRLEIRVRSEEGTVPVLLQRIQAAGLSVQTIQYNRPSLEDVFVTHTGRKIREEMALR